MTSPSSEPFNPEIQRRKISGSYAALSRQDEESDEPYRKIVDNATDHYDVVGDCWNAMLFIVLKDVPDMMAGILEYEMMLRVTMVTICYVINVFLQLGLLYWIATMVTLPSIRRAQTFYRNYHQKGFNNVTGDFNITAFEEMGEERQDICQIALSSQLFLMAILFLFAAQCFRELRAINRRRRLLHQLPWLPTGREPADMVYEAEIGMGHFVERKLIFCCINRMTSVAVYGLILIPKCLIACGLAGLGCCWLASSASFGDLILNSLALVFVTDIDEILFNVFLPPRLEDNLSKLKIALAPNEKLTEEERDLKDVHDAYCRSAWFLAGTILFVLGFMLFQPVIPNFARDVHVACEGYLNERRRIECMPMEENCFPFQMNATVAR